MSSNLSKPLALKDIVKDVMPETSDDQDTIKQVVDELTKMMESQQYGIGKFGPDIWIMLAIPAESAPASGPSKN